MLLFESFPQLSIVLALWKLLLWLSGSSMIQTLLPFAMSSTPLPSMFPDPGASFNSSVHTEFSHVRAGARAVLSAQNTLPPDVHSNAFFSSWSHPFKWLLREDFPTIFSEKLNSRRNRNLPRVSPYGQHLADCLEHSIWVDLQQHLLNEERVSEQINSSAPAS